MINGGDEALADAIIARRRTNPFDGLNPDETINNFLSARGEFHRFLASVVADAQDLADLLQFTDPNRYDPADASTRTPTTYFCFDSGGCYEIEALGEYRGAKARLKKAVCVYRKIYQTTKAEFDNNFNYARVSTRDNFPLNLSVCYAGYVSYDPTTAETVKNAVKLGFWDDFSNAAESTAVWLKLNGNYTISGGKLVTTSGGNWPVIKLGTGLEWRMSDFSAVMHIEDEVNSSMPRISIPLNWENLLVPEAPPPPPPDPLSLYVPGMWGLYGPFYERAMNAGHLLFRSQGSEAEGTLYIANVQIESGWTIVGAKYLYFKPEIALLSQKLVLDAQQGNNHAVDCGGAYQPNKTFHLVVKGNTASAEAYWGAAPVAITHTWAAGILPDEGYVAL
jgi:hypothetical protein